MVSHFLHVWLVLHLSSIFITFVVSITFIVVITFMGDTIATTFNTGDLNLSIVFNPC